MKTVYLFVTDLHPRQALMHKADIISKMTAKCYSCSFIMNFLQFLQINFEALDRNKDCKTNFLIPGDIK